jgi:DNA-binding response OmpR family regulator
METKPDILVSTGRLILGSAIQTLLQAHGFQVDLAETPQQVLWLLLDTEYQLVIFGHLFINQIPLPMLRQILRSIPYETKVAILAFSDPAKEVEFVTRSGFSEYEDISPKPVEVLRYVSEQLKPSEDYGSPFENPM